MYGNAREMHFLPLLCLVEAWLLGHGVFIYLKVELSFAMVKCPLKTRKPLRTRYLALDCGDARTLGRKKGGRMEQPQRKDPWASGAAYNPYVGRWSRLVAREF